MEKADIDKCFDKCVAFQDSAIYHSSEHAELLLARKVLLEFLNPTGDETVAKTLAALEEAYAVEAEQAARYYFACGVNAAEGKTDCK